MTFTGTLTPDQLTHVHEVRDEWMRIALSTERCERPAAEAAVRASYLAADLAEPPLVVWMDSPLGGVLASAFIRNGLKRDQLRGQLGDQLGGQLGGQLWDQLGGQLRGQLRGQLGDQLWGQLWGQLGDQLGDQLWGQLGDQLRGQLNPWSEAYWLALYGLAMPMAESQVPSRLVTMTTAIRETGWWWPMRGAVVLTDRPTTLSRDNLGRLHGESGPALSYADSYCGYWWHGVRVPEDLIEGPGWDPSRILTERNAEIRRCAIEKFGWPEFVTAADLRQVGATVPDPGNPGAELALYDVPAEIYDAPVRVLVCRNGTQERDGAYRQFGLTVPAQISDPISAAGWTYGLDPVDYRQLVHRS